MKRESLDSQCRRRKIERPLFKQMADEMTALVDQKMARDHKVVISEANRIQQKHITQALDRLPSNASIALQRQVIREAME